MTWMIGGLISVALLLSISSATAENASRENCDPVYPDEDVCIPSPPPDLDCGEIEYDNFTVREPDPHRFDGDNDGIGCES